MKRIPFISMLIILFATGHGLKAQSSGLMTFTAKTVDNNAQFSPKHVLAVWIEDENGNFVKTLEVMAQKRIEYLYTWNTASSGNTTDAVTGATLSSHRTENVEWDCTNTQGNLVADGNYKVIIEYTSAHEQGPLASFTFNKSTGQVSLQPGDETYFSNIGMTYTPDATTIDDSFRSVEKSLNIYPNPFSHQLSVDFTSDSRQDVKINLYNNRMQLVDVIYNGEITAGHNTFNWNTGNTSLPPANYYIIIENGSSIIARSIIKVN
ncbi:MAG TPA: DUF2271 domain-containing protein [Bacteroidales bacterium]|nr:DUF2271 domain-containing protein [Bacteroidales bacterium]